MAKDGVMPNTSVILYTDKPECEFDYSSEELLAILDYFGTDKWDVVHAKPTVGFESGVEWEEMAREKNIAAIVLFDVNDACVHGIYAEAYLTAGIMVYELFCGELVRYEKLPQIDRCQPVLLKVR